MPKNIPRNFIIALLIGIFGMIVYGFIRPYIVFRSFEEYGLLAVASLTAGFMLARAFSSLYSGLLISSKGYGFTGSYGLFLLAIAYYVYTVVPVNVYPIVRILEGFASGLLWPSIQALVVSSVPSNWRARGLSIYFVLGSVAYYFSVWIASPLRHVIGYNGLFTASILIIIGMAIVYGIIMWKVKPSYSIGKTEFYIYYKLFRKTIDLVPIAIVMGGVGGLSLDYLLAYARGISDFSRDLARLYWSYAGYLGLALSLIFSYMADKYGGEKINYGIAYIVFVSLMVISMPSNPLLLYSLLSLPMIGNRVFKPVIRSTMASRVDKKELAITYTNMLTNIGAAVVTLSIAVINHFIPLWFNLGLMLYSIISIASITIVYLKIFRRST